MHLVALHAHRGWSQPERRQALWGFAGALASWWDRGPSRGGHAVASRVIWEAGGQSGQQGTAVTPVRHAMRLTCTPPVPVCVSPA
jgi:hypothetical protein